MLCNIHKQLLASKQEPLELFCFILAVVLVTFVVLLLLHIVVCPPPLTLRKYHCGTMTVTARRGNRGALAADGTAHFFIS